ncbi:hypothetical protein I302_106489 [Kwoniella bestiolae CBS 10118]|uniref:Uncharacterized protein n=1 Tax=Kwoniella bestiolae CBS 10118 TaxID=1296100 RepID=A0A1B9G190_9TREE|nr:hypothetical protein I302_06253 [Kwoniella bestiolae CBS 10118]OCF24792.1 hypothetical protein I302_06253 [Kwoniella bestiolae CBS 10118]
MPYANVQRFTKARSSCKSSTRPINAFVRPRSTTTYKPTFTSGARSSPPILSTVIRYTAPKQHDWSRRRTNSHNHSKTTSKPSTKTSEQVRELGQDVVLDSSTTSVLLSERDDSRPTSANHDETTKSVRFTDDTLDTCSSSKAYRTVTSRRIKREREASNPGLRLARFFAGNTRR